MTANTGKAFTRNRLNWIKRFSNIAGAFDLPVQAIIDGEVVVVHEGRADSPNCKQNSLEGTKIACCITPLIRIDRWQGPSQNASDRAQAAAQEAV
ncbi:hypothetical protein MTR72_34090 [Bradyrhizobium sp. ISRA442]|uniref:hypothetical protein n=1 Tax=Bradyrhizobium sp. ISRA442 TaxID=2866197 RepID=UPI00311B013C